MNHTTNTPQQEIPYGYCHCGCGQRTTVVKQTRSERGYVKGQYTRFIVGHGNEKPFTPMPQTPCECGCGQLVPLSDENNATLGYVRGRSKRFIRGHTPQRPIERRFWEKVDKNGPNGCWIWMGTKRPPYWYGYIWINRANHLAHRLSWEIHNGPIPEGLDVCHNCPGGDNPSCVNPAHLWLGTPKDNTQDMWKKGRHPVLVGEQIGSSKLTESDVVEIRSLCAQGNLTYKEIGELKGVRENNIYLIFHRKIWKHVP